VRESKYEKVSKFYRPSTHPFQNYIKAELENISLKQNPTPITNVGEREKQIQQYQQDPERAEDREF